MRLLILSNRLRVTITEENNSFNIQPSSGGLATGLSSYLSSLKKDEYLWIGWTGSSSYTNQEKVINELTENYNSWPVFIEENTMELFYNGFCNKTLWPLFHYLHFLSVFDEKMWENYKEVNNIFAEEVIKIIKPGDTLWIHDYHFMLVSKLIKEKKPDIPVGFFLHIPFPSYEIFRILPRKWGKEILEGLLGADLIGFHTQDYTQYFLRCVLRILGYNHNLGLISLPYKITKADTFPMGIDYEKYNGSGKLPAVKKEKKSLKKKLQNMKIILSVDRQDYTKGILNRLEGFELFLNNNTGWHQKVVLIMIVVPSRIGVEDYQKAKDIIHQKIGNINGIFGDINWTPIIYQYKAVTFEHLMALYNISDVGLVTPLRDGMNLIAKEYIASQTEKHGMLILSEMAGAAKELGEAVIVNPNNREEIAEGIKSALDMPVSEKLKHISAMQERLKNNDVNKWAAKFLEELKRTREEQKNFGTSLLSGRELFSIINKFRAANNKIFFLDYDGTLVPFAKNPSEAVPDKQLLKTIKLLSLYPNVNVVIISGRNKKDLNAWYSNFNITLVAEHGVWIKKPGMEWKQNKNLNNDWKPKIIDMLEPYRESLPKSFIEEKDYSVAWHYRNSDITLSELRVKEFVDGLIQFTASNDIDILMGNKVVEIKCLGINKGETAKKLLNEKEYDFILAAGDDETDESLFQILPKNSHSIKIGRQKSYASFYLNSSQELVDVLDKLIDNKKELFYNVFNIFKKT